MKTPETDWLTCFNKGIRSATAFLRRNGCTPIKGHYQQGYHYCSGFFHAPNGSIWYFMTGDDRLVSKKDGSPRSFMDLPLVRTAKDLKDYTGGTNNYPRNAAEFSRLVNQSF